MQHMSYATSPSSTGSGTPAQDMLLACNGLKHLQPGKVPDWGRLQRHSLLCIRTCAAKHKMQSLCSGSNLDTGGPAQAVLLVAACLHCLNRNTAEAEHAKEAKLRRHKQWQVDTLQ